MPIVQIYFTDEEYSKYLKEAEKKALKVSKLLVEKIRQATP